MHASGRVAAAAFALLPGALTVYLSFNAGGFFVAAPALAAVVVAAALVLRTMLARRPFEGIGPSVAVVAGGLALLAIWTLASAWWSDAPARSLIEFDRVLLYTLVVVACAAAPRSLPRLRLVAGGVALALIAVCVAGLVTRLAPDVWSIPLNVEEDRLSYPLTYWNALGLMAAFGILLCVHGSASERESRAVRVVSAAALPALGVTLLLTFSRGAIAACALGAVAYLVLARPRGLLGALVAAGPAVYAVLEGYHADLLATPRYTEMAGIEQGHHVATVVALACLAAGLLRAAMDPLDRRVARIAPPGVVGRRVAMGVATVAVIAAAGTAVALGAPGYVDRQAQSFVDGSEVAADNGDRRERLTDAGNNGRIDLWKASLDAYRADPGVGSGAGTFQITWARERKLVFEVNDGHSLYVEVLGELGLVGAGLLLLALGGLLVAAGLAVRGRERHLQAAIFAILLAWAARAGIDWDWELPAVTLPVLALGAAAVARPGGWGRIGGAPRQVTRLVVGLAWLVLAVTPGLVALSQHHLGRSLDAYRAGDCPEAIVTVRRSRGFNSRARAASALGASPAAPRTSESP